MVEAGSEREPAGGPPSPEAAARVRRLEKSAGKLAAIGGGSALLLVVGLPFALFAAVLAGVYLRRPGWPPKVHRRLRWALGLGLGATVWHGVWIAVLVRQY